MQNEKPDPENVKSWAAKAEAAALPSVIETDRVKAFEDYGCSKEPFTFDAPPAAAAAGGKE